MWVQFGFELINSRFSCCPLRCLPRLHSTVVAQITSPSTHQIMIADPNGNLDSGYVPSNVEETTIVVGTQTPVGSPRYTAQTIVNTAAVNAAVESDQRGNGFEVVTTKKEPLR